MTVYSLIVNFTTYDDPEEMRREIMGAVRKTGIIASVSDLAEVVEIEQVLAKLDEIQP